MPKPLKENELLPKADQFKTYREKLDKILARLAREHAQLIGVNNTPEEKKELLLLEMKYAKQVKEIDEKSYQQIWNYDGSFDKLLMLHG